MRPCQRGRDREDGPTQGACDAIMMGVAMKMMAALILAAGAELDDRWVGKLKDQFRECLDGLYGCCRQAHHCRG